MSQILSANDISEVQAALRKAADGKAVCQKAASCGIDLSGHEAALFQIEERLKAVLREFGHKGASPA